VQIVFVNYFTVLPEHGTCARIALTIAEADHLRATAARPAPITQRVATQTGAGLMDASIAASADND
jgi:hypothetical protein